MRGAIQRASKVLTTSSRGPKQEDAASTTMPAQTVEALKESLTSLKQRLDATTVRADEAEAAAGAARVQAKEAEADAKYKGAHAEKLATQLEGREAEVNDSNRNLKISACCRYLNV